MENSCKKSDCPASEEAEQTNEQRLWALEAQWQRKMAALRAAPCSEAVEETTIEQDAAEMHKAFRHNMSPEDWNAFQKLIHRQKIAKWQTFIGSIMGDYDSCEIFVLLQFKTDRMMITGDNSRTLRTATASVRQWIWQADCCKSLSSQETRIKTVKFFRNT